MRSLSWIQAKINRNGVLSAALKDGSIQVVYKKAEISSDELSVTWRLTVFIVDITIGAIVRKALARMGFSVEAVGETLYATQEFLLSSDEKGKIRQEAEAAKQQQKEEEAKATVQTLKATETTVSDLQQQIEALREELELIRLMPAAKGRRGNTGRKGDKGEPGAPGKDLVATEANLGDLQDVSDLPPEPGQVLTWDQIDQQWTPKSAKTALASIGGGGAGGGGSPLTVGTYGPDGDVDTVTEVTAIRFSTSSGFNVVEGINGNEALVDLNSTFKTWRIPGQDDLVAQGEDLINITASGSITLTTSTVGDVKTLNIHAPGVPDGNGTGSLTYWEETETADLVPVDDESQDLGSMTKSIRGIYLGGKLLSVNEYGELCVDHQPLAYAFAQYDGRDVVVDASDWNDVADGGEITLLQSQLTYTLEEPNNFTTPPADGGTLEEDE